MKQRADPRADALQCNSREPPHRARYARAQSSGTVEALLYHLPSHTPILPWQGYRELNDKLGEERKKKIAAIGYPVFRFPISGSDSHTL
jgi:hypothetical protein